MFDRIAGRYDLLNRMLSFGRDVAWRKRLIRYLPVGNDLRVLDLATGTGDVLLTLCERSHSLSSGVGIDMAEQMLERARKKIAGRGLQERLKVLRGDAMEIPLGDSEFNVTTIAFGIRNLTDVSVGLKEMFRVLKPGGKVLVLEFSLPSNRLIRTGYLLYFRHLLPVVGGLISGDQYAYKYLNRTVETFPYGREFCILMERARFVTVREHRMTFGIATIYEGTRPAHSAAKDSR